jgi:hypothetical protein
MAGTIHKMRKHTLLTSAAAWFTTSTELHEVDLKKSAPLKAKSAPKFQLDNKDLRIEEKPLAWSGVITVIAIVIMLLLVYLPGDI